MQYVDDILTILEDIDLSAYGSSRVHVGNLPKKVDHDVIILINPISQIPLSIKDGPATTDEVRVQIDVLAGSFSHQRRAYQVANVVRNALDQSTTATITHMYLDQARGAAYDYNIERWHVGQDYLLHYTNQ